MTRAVTERDFRMPEFKDAKAEDYEFRADGKLVRKDRWEKSMHKIVSVLGMNNRSFECCDVIFAIERLVNNLPTLCQECGCEITGKEMVDFGVFCSKHGVDQ
jgi:hypothetical protein